MKTTTPARLLVQIVQMTKARFHLTQEERRGIAVAISQRLSRLVYTPPHFPADQDEIKLLQHLSNVFKYREKRDRDRP